MKHTKADLKENLVLVQKRYWIILVLRHRYLDVKQFASKYSDATRPNTRTKRVQTLGFG